MPNMDGFELATRVKATPLQHEPTLIMLTSGNQSGESERARGLGIAAYLTKPVRQSELYDTLMRSLGSPAKPAPTAASTPVQSLSRDAATSPDRPEGVRVLQILLAEDHVVNQKVAVGLIKGLGHETVVVGDGRQAVAAWQEGSFDLILMDISMPEMDGFEALAAIREAERPSGRHIPVVALTAHAMKGDRERCIDAGFDNYLSKPIRSTDLRTIIEGITDRPDESSLLSSEPEPTTPSGEFHYAEALAGLGDDEALLVEVITLFLDDYPRLIGEIDAAIAAADLAQLGRLVHSIRGVASNFAIPVVLRAAQTLESLTKAGDAARLSSACDDLKAAVARVQPELEAVTAFVNKV